MADHAPGHVHRRGHRGLRAGRHRDALPARRSRCWPTARCVSTATSRRTPVRWVRCWTALTALGASVDADRRRGCRSPSMATARRPWRVVGDGRCLDLQPVRQRPADGRRPAARRPGPAARRPAHPLPAAHRDDRRDAPRAARPDRRLRARPLGGRARADRRRTTRRSSPTCPTPRRSWRPRPITGGAVTVPHWPGSTEQPGDAIRDILTAVRRRGELRRAGPDRTRHRPAARDRPGPVRRQRADPGGRRGRRAGRRHQPPPRHRPHPRPRDRPAGRARHRAGAARRPSRRDP